MQKGRYPDKWAKNKYNMRLPFAAPYSKAEKEQPLVEELPTVEELPVMEELPVVEKTPVVEEEMPEPAILEEEKTPAEMQDKIERPARAAVAVTQHHQTQQEAEFICGKNAVLAALRSGQSINRVLLAEGLNSAFAAEVIKRCKAQGVTYQYAPKAKLAAIAGPEHRGVVCEPAAFNYAEIEDMLAAAHERNEQPLLLLLDSVEDPHNLGAVIRTALCVGAHGVIIPKRRAAALNATVAKTSAGASAYLPVARVANLSQTARALKEAGLWLAAADMDGQTAWEAPLNGPLALVLGGEDKGVSPLLKQACDFCVSLPMSGNLGSLNVSAAAAALLYEIRRQRDC